METIPARQGAAPSLGWGAEEDRSSQGGPRELRDAERQSPVQLPLCPHCPWPWDPLTRPRPRPGSRLALGCHRRQLLAPLPQGSCQPLLRLDALPLWALSTGPCFAHHWSSSGGSFPFYLTSFSSSSSSLCFSAVGIGSSQLNQPSRSFPSKHQHCRCATFVLANSQEILPYNLLFIPHIFKPSVLAALLLLQEHFLFFCPFFLLHFPPLLSFSLAMAFFQQLIIGFSLWTILLCVWDLDFDPKRLGYISPLFKASL